jgi:hypothetical protein
MFNILQYIFELFILYFFCYLGKFCRYIELVRSSDEGYFKAAMSRYILPSVLPHKQIPNGLFFTYRHWKAPLMRLKFISNLGSKMNTI